MSWNGKILRRSNRVKDESFWRSHFRGGFFRLDQQRWAFLQQHQHSQQQQFHHLRHNNYHDNTWKQQSVQWVLSVPFIFFSIFSPLTLYLLKTLFCHSNFHMIRDAVGGGGTLGSLNRIDEQIIASEKKLKGEENICNFSISPLSWSRRNCPFLNAVIPCNNRK